MKQILLITDGCSNVGMSPVIAAAHAKAEAISVNVIGVLDDGDLGEYGAQEIAEIAKAGGGMSRLVNTKELTQTVQMMTRKTVVQTIQQAVHKELQQVLGTSSIDALPPEKRGEVVRVMEQLTETTALKIALLIDASASMKHKLPAVEEAIADLMLSLQARQGDSEIAVFHFPANKHGGDCAMDIDFTNQFSKLNNVFHNLPLSGTTPTGPAIMHVLHAFGEQFTDTRRVDDEMDGPMSEYA